LLHDLALGGLLYFFVYQIQHSRIFEERENAMMSSLFSSSLFLSSRSVLVRNQHHNHGDNRQSAQKVQAQMTTENKPRAQGKCNLGTGIVIGHAFVMQYFALILFSSFLRAEGLVVLGVGLVQNCETRKDGISLNPVLAHDRRQDTPETLTKNLEREANDIFYAESNAE
jgi:hypothetical protein